MLSTRDSKHPGEIKVNQDLVLREIYEISTQKKSLSNHTTAEQPARANASGLCEGGCVKSRGTELPLNSDSRAPRVGVRREKSGMESSQGVGD